MLFVKICKILSDETRYRILNLLNYSELCVCEITDVLGATQSNISRHLGKLAWVSYKINPAILSEYPF